MRRLLILAALAVSSCGPSRWVMRGEGDKPEAVCYSLSGGLFGGPALSCLPDVPDGGR